MSEAGDGRAWSEPDPAFENDPDVVAVAAAYVELSAGDLRRALLEAVADGLSASRSVSRGFVRWGRPARRTDAAWRR